MFGIFSNQSRLQGGFTLLESMVALSIVTIIASISFTGITSYSEYFTLKDSARSLETTFKTAQGYAINIQDVSTGSQFLGKFGVKFDKNIGDEVIFYADSQGVGSEGELGFNIYDETTGCPERSECIERTTFQRGITVSDVCTTDVNDIRLCNRFDRFDILFVRPRADARVYINGTESTSIKEVEIFLSTATGRSIPVIIGKTGFITS